MRIAAKLANFLLQCEFSSGTEQNVMKILIVGGGGREHALAWKVAQSTKVSQVYVAPGNAGTAQETSVQNVVIAADDVVGLVNFAKSTKIDLTIVGPEAPLVAGIVDEFQRVGLRCFGASRAAAQLEGSKIFTKDFLARHHIPTAAYGTFTELEPALAYLKLAYLLTSNKPVVIKADGLAAGKGVIIAQTEQQAITAVTQMLAEQAFGKAGQRIVIEEFLQGEEASFICMVDSEHILPLATSQDHKAVNEGDQGLNTGGMGAYSPAPVVTPEMHDRIMRTIIEPTVRGMAAEGNPYSGFLYAGLMINAQGVPYVLEYNCRLGDPETQPIMMRLQSDLVELCGLALDKRLHLAQVTWDQRAALGVVLVAGGYPGDYEKGKIINGLSEARKLELLLSGKVFHSGTEQKAEQIVTAGGRVLCVTALGNTVKAAQTAAYQITQPITWEHIHYRKDIGYRAIVREG
jgi:phosphoribosylamine--glycine ligase